MQNYKTEDGLYVGVEIIKENNDKPKIQQVYYEPTWVNRYKKQGKYYYEVLPARLALKDKDGYNVFEEAIEKRLTLSSKRTIELIEKPLNASSEEYFERYLLSHTSKE